MAAVGTMPDPLAVLMSLPECARNCLPSSDICERAAEGAVEKCFQTACTVRDALAAQNITQSSCGVKPDVDQSYIPVGAVFLVFALIAIGMRFTSSFSSIAGYGWTDRFLGLAMAGGIAYSAIGFEASQHGLGADMWSVAYEDITHLFTGYYVGMLVYTTSRLFLRHSIVLFYLRIFTTGNPRPIIIGTTVVNTVLSLVILGLMAFQCRPIGLFWTRWDLQHEGYCLPEKSVSSSSMIISLLMDIWVLVLPFPYVTRLQLPLRKRLGIASTLASGSVLVIIFSILKLVAINNMENSANQTATLSRIATWATLEIDLGVICACLPGIRLLISTSLKNWGFIKQDDSVRRPRRVGFGTNLSSTDKKPPSQSSATSQGSGKSHADMEVRITTTIQLQPYTSETSLSLKSIEGGNHPPGGVRSHAWA